MCPTHHYRYSERPLVFYHRMGSSEWAFHSRQAHKLYEGTALCDTGMNRRCAFAPRAVPLSLFGQDAPPNRILPRLKAIRSHAHQFLCRDLALLARGLYRKLRHISAPFSFSGQDAHSFRLLLCFLCQAPRGRASKQSTF